MARAPQFAEVRNDDTVAPPPQVAAGGKDRSPSESHQDQSNISYSNGTNLITGNNLAAAKLHCDRDRWQQLDRPITGDQRSNERQ